MPCDMILTQSIDFKNAVGHIDVLLEALRERGYQAERCGESIRFSKGGLSGVYSDGEFKTQRSYGASELDVDSIKQTFSKHVIRKAAKVYGWTVVEKGNNKYEIRKRA